MTIESGTTRNLCSVFLAFLLITFCGCNNTKKIYTVGIITYDQGITQTLAGFQSGMAERGYVEGENVRYIYESLPISELHNYQYIASRLVDLMIQDLDLLVTMGLEVSLKAKALTEGTDVAVLFSGNIDPVGAGLVESLQRPGGNVTGVRFTNSIPKALEWLKKISGAGKIYVPYNPDDDISIECLKELHETAGKTEIELVHLEVHSVEEAIEAIETLQADAGGVYRVPSPLLDPRSIEISEAAIRRRIAMCSPHRVDDVILATFSNDQFSSGKILARLAQQIDQGIKPSDLPVETVDVFLTINLKTAEKIGLDIPAEVLMRAKKIVR